MAVWWQGNILTQNFGHHPSGAWAFLCLLSLEALESSLEEIFDVKNHVELLSMIGKGLDHSEDILA